MKFLRRVLDFIFVSFDQTIGSMLRIPLSIGGDIKGIKVVRRICSTIFSCFLVWFIWMLISSAITEYVGNYAVAGDSSMAPTIEQNELLLYKTCKEDTVIKYRDIVITRVTGNENVIERYNEADYYTLEGFENINMSIAYGIERILALPGDTVKITEGKIYVNNELLTEDYVFSTIDSSATYNEFTLESDQYFSLPDNRELAEYDTIRHHQINGVVIFR